MRRRGVWRRQSGGGGASRLLERLRELKKLGLRDVRALDRRPAVPEGIELGSARFEDRVLALVASRRDGLDLLGWARVAALRADENGPLREAIVAAPVLSGRTRRAAARASESGPAVVLLTLPALADPSDEVFDVSGLSAAGRQLGVDDSSSVLGRVVRVVEGAVAITSAGAVRPTGDGYAVYLRGERVGLVQREADGAAVTMLLPDRHRIQVNEGNFARWGPDLHEMIVQLAQDPRLLDAEATAGGEFERAAAEVEARITACWIPWSGDGADPLDWAGIDASGRPVLGASATSVGLADVPRLVAGLHLLEEERDLWVPGSLGSPRLALACDSIDPEARSLLAPALSELTAVAVLERPDEAQEPRARRGRRRSRRRPRRQRPEEAPSEEAADAGEAEVARSARGAEAGDVELDAEVVEEADEERPEEREDSRRGGRGRRSRSRRPRPERGAEAAVTAATLEGEDTDDELAPEPEDLAEERSEEEEPTALELGAELAEAEEPGVPSEPDEAQAEPLEPPEQPEPPEPPEPVRRRRARAAVIVRDDPDCILAALVLARERRSVVSFRTCTQEGLMDFFRGPATDIGDNTDVLLVGFTCHPHATDTLNTAELFQGRLQWFDHHEWAPEDLERLRRAIGDDAVLTAEGASSPLPAILQIAERRSRFTDKLVELSGRRLSENDMEKWGYRLVGLIEKMVQKPGEYRADISALLSGKPTDLPRAESVYANEATWVEENDPRIVHFGGYQLAVVRVPKHLDAGEVGRRVRLSTGSRLSLASREGEGLLLLGCNEERHPVNVVVLADQVGSGVSWAHAKPGADRVGRIEVDDLEGHPERLDAVIGEIVRNRSILYG